MVKGTAKQAVVLHPGDKSGFEQAIFILSPGQSGERWILPKICCGWPTALPKNIQWPHCRGYGKDRSGPAF